MSDDKVIHVAHEFVPKLLRRKVEVALANRDAFVMERKRRMVPYLLANRNAAIAFRSLPWYKKGMWNLLFSDQWDGPVLSIADAVRVPFDDFNTMDEVTSFWGRPSNGHPYDCVVYGPHHKEISKLMDEIHHGSKWVKHIRVLSDNLKRTPTRRVSVSESILSSITYWAAQSN